MSAVWQYFDKLPDNQFACKSCDTLVANSNENNSNIFHHLMKKHPVLYREAKLQARHTLDEDRDCKKMHLESLKIEHENENSCADNDIVDTDSLLYQRPALDQLADSLASSSNSVERHIVKASIEPRQAILSFMSNQTVPESFYPFDAMLLCRSGSVQIHRLTLAAMSPLLATIMNNDAEEADIIFVEGTDRATLLELVEILYKGGTPSAACECVMGTLRISPDGIPKDFRLPTPPLHQRNSKLGVKNEPEDLSMLYSLSTNYLDASVHNDPYPDDSCSENEEDLDGTDYPFNALKLETHERIILSRLRTYYYRPAPNNGDGQEAGTNNTNVRSQKMICSLCQQIVNADNEAMVEHFSQHPVELEDISVIEKKSNNHYKTGVNNALHNSSKKRQRSKVWNYFQRTEETKAACRKCGVQVKINMGSTTQMIYHLRTKHEDDYEGFESTRENDVLDLDVTTQVLGEADTNEDKKKKGTKRRSKIWFYYRLVSPGISECKECGKRIITAKQARGSTSGLIHHLKHHHRSQYNIFQAIKESRCSTKEEFNEISNEHGVKVEEDLRPPVSIQHHPPKKIKREKKVKKTTEKKRQRIWGYFTATSESWAQCIECEEKVSMDHGSTSMMVHHLKRTHPHSYRQYDGDRETKCELVMCEYCSETYDKQKMLQHNYTTHYDLWVEGAKMRYEVLKQKLIAKYEAGPFYKQVQSYYTSPNPDFFHENTVVCKFCHTMVHRDGGQMESHISVHPELEMPEPMSLSCWLLAKPIGGQIGCNLCGGTQFESESLYASHIAECHKSEHLDLQDWDDVIPNPGDPFSFKTALLLEKYDKTFNYWEAASKSNGPEYGKMDDAVFRTCCECRKVFSTSSAMRYHQRVVHSGDKPFKCDLCEKAFNRKDTLESHLASHSDLKPFMCSVCGKQFGRRHIRDTHERRHKGEKKYPCTRCSKRFMSSQQLKNHIRVHTGEKPFSCEHCGRLFAVKHQLVTHLRIHTGERPYGCGKCDQKFKHLSTRRNHKCAGDLKQAAAVVAAAASSAAATAAVVHHASIDPIVDPRELYRIPIPQNFHTGL